MCTTLRHVDNSKIWNILLDLTADNESNPQRAFLRHFTRSVSAHFAFRIRRFVFVTLASNVLSLCVSFFVSGCLEDFSPQIFVMAASDIRYYELLTVPPRKFVPTSALLACPLSHRLSLAPRVARGPLEHEFLADCAREAILAQSCEDLHVWHPTSQDMFILFKTNVLHRPVLPSRVQPPEARATHPVCTLPPGAQEANRKAQKFFMGKRCGFLELTRSQEIFYHCRALAWEPTSTKMLVQFGSSQLKVNRSSRCWWFNKKTLYHRSLCRGQEGV